MTTECALAINMTKELAMLGNIPIGNRVRLSLIRAELIPQLMNADRAAMVCGATIKELKRPIANAEYRLSVRSIEDHLASQREKPREMTGEASSSRGVMMGWVGLSPTHPA